MLVKFEQKTARVKGLAFHPKRPWLLTSLHNGTVEIWDYRMKSVVHSYTEHDGPVRSCAFHPTQPLFVTGGDDGKVKLWNWLQKRCVFTFTGHQDYIRSVQFHHESPWIISASDDQTIRIWNWQSRQSIAQLTGHSHYVMSAFFHPKEDIVVSASLDQTIRVWDTSSLKRKRSVDKTGIDLFANNEVQVKFIIEGHDRGVNWATFHPEKPIILSGSDDRTVRLWRYSETRAWETDTFRGHHNNVSSAIFHPRMDAVISNGEDKTMRLWNIGTKGQSGITLMRRETDRFWTLAAHPDLNLFAAGHDSGFMIFKLDRERPGLFVEEDFNRFYVVKESGIKMFDFSRKELIEKVISTFEKPISLPVNAQLIPSEQQILISNKNQTFLVNLIKGQQQQVANGSFACLYARNKWISYEPNEQLLILASTSDLRGKNIPSPLKLIKILPALQPGHVFLVSLDIVAMFDVQQEKIVNQLEIQNAKYIIHGPICFAIIAKDAIHVVDRQTITIKYSIVDKKIKSACWDPTGTILFFTTFHHLKFLLPNKESNVIMTVQEPCYLIRMLKADTIQALKRYGSFQMITFDPTEYQFKFALLQNDLNRVFNLIQTGNLAGQAIIAYLKEHGWASIALEFVDNPKEKLELAIECGNLQEAFKAAEKINHPNDWIRFAEEAIKLGDHLIAEIAYKKANLETKASFLRLLSGQPLLDEVNDDYSSNGNNHHHHVPCSIDSFIQRGDQYRLARELADHVPVLSFLALKSSGKDSDAYQLAKSYSKDCSYPSSALPSTKIAYCNELAWPLIEEPHHSFSLEIQHQQQQQQQQQQIQKEPTTTMPIFQEETLSDMEKGGWDDLKLPSLSASPTGSFNEDQFTKSSGVISGRKKEWIALDSPVPFDHIATERMEKALMLLERQAGVTNIEPLRPLFDYIKSVSVITWEDNDQEGSTLLMDEDGKHPRPVYDYDRLEDLFKAGMAATTSGRFPDAIENFRQLLHMAPLSVLKTDGEAANVAEWIHESGKYIVALRMELKRKELSATATDNKNDKQILLLACWFCNMGLRSEHLILSLRSAMTIAYKLKCWRIAAILASRLSETTTDDAIYQQAKKVAQLAERSTEREPFELEDDEWKNTTSFDASRLTPINGPSRECPYCEVLYMSDANGRTCTICEISQIGKKSSGLILIR